MMDLKNHTERLYSSLNFKGKKLYFDKLIPSTSCFRDSALRQEVLGTSLVFSFIQLWLKF